MENCRIKTEFAKKKQPKKSEFLKNRKFRIKTEFALKMGKKTKVYFLKRKFFFF